MHSPLILTKVVASSASQRASESRMSSPSVTGAAALYLASHPTAKPAAVKAALLKAATAAGSANPRITGTPRATTTLSLYCRGLTDGANV